MIELPAEALQGDLELERPAVRLQGGEVVDRFSRLINPGRAVPRYQNPAAKGATPDKPGVSLAWFNAIYQVLLGEEKGPRFGSFVALYGIDNTRALIARALSGELARTNP